MILLPQLISSLWDSCPISKVDSILTNLRGVKVFIKIDHHYAYLQLPLGATFWEVLTISSHLGLFQYDHLLFVIASVTAIL